jgi:hypothetical protein
MKIEINEGFVTNDGAVIGTIDGNVCHLKNKVGPTVKGAIRKESGIVDLQFIAGDAPGQADEDKVEALTSLADMSDDELAAEMVRRGLIQDAPEAPAIVMETPPLPDSLRVTISAIERLHKLADAGQIPTPPAKHPAMGDKTPEYVAWFKAHATLAEIAARYPTNRRVPASTAEFFKAEAKLQEQLPGEKKDTPKENDFTGEGDA